MVFQRSLVSLGIVFALASCGGDDSGYNANDTTTFAVPDPVTYADPTLSGEVSYTNVSVHDPSIIQDTDGTYYVFGSHLAYAKSSDLMSWEQLADDGVTASTLFSGSYAEQAAEGVEWVGGDVGSWAPDVKILEDGKYHFYFDHCSGDGDDGTSCYRRSYLGVATADSITGPYVTDEIFLKSGQVTGEEDELPDGATSYDGATDPNAIDPAVFYDADGGLWMTYGSYSGGIFVLELDPDTGKPLDGQGFGTHIAGGNYAPVEGSYIIYSPETEYYYLFTSFAGYDQTGGYNIRVSRSTSPKGPFVDAEGNDMTGAASTDLDTLAEYGVKLMGGFLFDANTGDEGTDHGYMSPGHNSAFYDSDTGQYFLVFHTRFPETGETHYVRVHEMFMNEDGWLVASPHRYAPISGDNIVDESDIEGAYQFIDQGHDNNTEVHSSTYITLERSWTDKGTITGSYTGSYVMDDEGNITLTFDDLGTYTGVVKWQYNDDIEKLVPVFTAIADDGSSVWGSQLPVSDTTEALANIAAAISVPSATNTDIELVTTGTQDATITWSSSDTSVITTDGTVIRPAAGSGDATVTLTATITLNGESVTKEYTVVVKARYEYNRVAKYSFEDTLSDSLGNKEDGTYVISAIEASDGTAAYADGKEGQALALDGTYGIKLPDGLIDSNEYTVSLWMKANATTDSTPTFFGAATTSDWVSLLPQNWWNKNITLWSYSDPSWFSGDSGVATTLGQWTHLAFSVNHGVGTLIVDGEEVYSGTGFADLFTNNVGTFALGVNYWDTPFDGDIDELKIYDAALSAEDVKLLDVDGVTDAQTLVDSAASQLDLGDVTAVSEDLDLTTTGAFASVVSWASSDTSIIATDGSVTRPTEAQGDQTVTLTATFTLDGATATKEFTVTVRSMAAPTPLAEYNFDDSDLSDAQGSFANGTVVGATPLLSGGSVSYAEGVIGNALVLDGTSGVQLPNNLLDDNSYSISLWMNPSSLTSYTPVLFGYADSDNWISMMPNNPSGYTQVWAATDGSNYYDDAVTDVEPTVGTWSHMVLVVNGSKVNVYLDGELKVSGTSFPDVFGEASTTYFSLGVNFWDTPFKGMIDEVQFFDSAISADDVELLYREGTD